MSQERVIVFTTKGMPTSDGAGVRLTRFLGTPELPDLDPFLMLDRFASDDANDYIAGFPDHPHRGFETVTIMKDGRMRHGDSRGNSGVVGPGGIQWMTTGKGLIHSETPEQSEGRMAGFQLWVNLPSEKKMIEPAWFDHPSSDVPTEKREGAELRVLAGRTKAGTEGPGRSASPDTDIRLYDVEIAPGAEYRETLPEGHNAFLALYEGSAQGQGRAGALTLASPSVAVLSKGSSLSLRAGEEGAKLILAAGKPIGEPVARHGPFVMNTREELVAAFRDFEAGRLG
jgi:redox-sensitive bicupin YhaK (pirin superfamily)